MLKHDLEVFAKNLRWSVKHAVAYMAAYRSQESHTGIISMAIAPRKAVGSLLKVIPISSF